MHFITRLDRELYKCVSADIKTDEVILTDERVAHIKERHPGDFERYAQYLAQVIEQPDYILESEQPHTAFILKAVEDGVVKTQLILRLKVSGDPDGYKNSIITFLRIKDKKWEKYLRNKKILYKYT